MDASSPAPARKRGRPGRTCESLHLNLEEAKRGRTWLLLPYGYRDADLAEKYPLPTSRGELLRVALIPVPPTFLKRDGGCVYIRRAQEAYKTYKRKQEGALITLERKIEEVERRDEKFIKTLDKMTKDASRAVDEVRHKAGEAIASLNELFILGRKGIEGQMKAHLEGQHWQGEGISASAFRDCFKMVASAVKGFGLPSDQRAPAATAIFEEAARSIKATQDAVSLAPGAEDDKEPS